MKSRCATRRISPIYSLLVILLTHAWSASAQAVQCVAPGTYSVEVDSIPSRAWRGEQVYLFAPQGVSKAPLLFFLHGIGAHNPRAYREMLDYCASRGLAVIYAPYKKSQAMSRPIAAYGVLHDGFEQGSRHWIERLDTTRVGFVGHSYGAGAVPAMAWHWLKQRNWGEEGSFLFCMAPWYSYGLSQQQLQSFPSRTMLVMQVYEHDHINDHRMAKDIFDNIGISAERKTFLVVHADSSRFGTLQADHGVPSGTGGGVPLDALDSCAVWRPLTALAEHVFGSNKGADEKTWDSGDEGLASMGFWPDSSARRPMTATNTAFIGQPQNYYLNFWNHTRNPRFEPNSVFEALPFVRQRTRMTLRNYATLNPGAVDSSDGVVEVLAQQRSAVFARPDSGFAAPGPYQVVRRSFPHPGLGHGKVYLFSPRDLDGRLPVVVFLHGFQWPMPDFYKEYVLHLASHGYHVVFPSYMLYRTTLNNRKRYDLIVKGADEGLAVLRNRIDSTRIGFVGHSYGAGALPAVAWHYLQERRWGAAGSFMHIAAPWYVYLTRPEMFRRFPTNSRLLVQVFEEDRFNDWRIAEDLFYSFNIPFENKDFVIVNSDRRGDTQLSANHVAMLSGTEQVDAIDFYAVNRLGAALAACAFTSDSSDCAESLGGGSAIQRFMGTWPDGSAVKPLTITDDPQSLFASDTYLFEWKRPWNKRRNHYQPRNAARVARKLNARCLTRRNPFR